MSILNTAIPPKSVLQGALCCASPNLITMLYTFLESIMLLYWKKKNIGLLCRRILSHHKREMKLQLCNNMCFCSRSNLLIDSHCVPGISFIDGSVCIHSSKSFSTPANEKTHSFRPGLNSGLIDIMAWKWFIHLPHKLLLVAASALKPEPAAIYLLICIKLTLSEVIALISSVYYCTH